MSLFRNFTTSLSYLSKFGFAVVMVAVFLPIQSEARDYGDRVIYPKGHPYGSARNFHKGLMKKDDCGCDPSHNDFQSNVGKLLDVSINGKDDRAKLTAGEKRTPEYRQVGLVGGKGVSTATATVTGANCDVVITAAHAVKSKETGGYKTKNFKYYRDVATALKVSFAMKPVRTGWDTPETSEKVEYDWAIMRLDRPAYKNCVNLDVEEYRHPSDVECPGGHLSSVGTHKDSPKVKKINRQFKSFPPVSGEEAYATVDEIFLHNADTHMFSSGSPIYCNEPSGRLKLVGIHLGTASDTANYEESDDLEQGEVNEKHLNLGLSIWGDLKGALFDELAESKKRANRRGAVKVKRKKGKTSSSRLRGA